MAALKTRSSSGVTPSVIRIGQNPNARSEKSAKSLESKSEGAGAAIGRQQSKRKMSSTKRVSTSQVSRLLHRFILLAAAFGYVSISFVAVVDLQDLLVEDDGAFLSRGKFVSQALKNQIDTTTIRESPLVTTFLNNNTVPRNKTIFLDVRGAASFDMCDGMTASGRAIYAAENLRTLYAAIARDTAYNLTFVAANTTELIAPVVICDLDIVISGFKSLGVFNFLVRTIAEPDNVYILTVNFAIQMYKINLQSEFGPAGVGTLTFVNDLRETNSVECAFIVSLGYPFEAFNFRVYTLNGLTAQGSWILRGIPNGDPTDLSRIVWASSRSGFHIHTDTNQANIFTDRWLVSTNPIEAITGVEWVSTPYMYDTWAWVHYVQLAFGVELLSSLLLLVIISYQNLLEGKLWIGDGFMTVSRRTTLRGILVLLSWWISNFWSLLEFCIYTVNEAVQTDNMGIYSSLVYADLLAIYLIVCGLLGMLFRERVDPVLAMLSFHLGFAYRVAILHWFPSSFEKVDKFSLEFYNRGMLPPTDGQLRISPMRFWTPHSIYPVPSDIIACCLAPIFSTLAFVLLYIAAKKTYRHWRPDPLRIVRLTGSSNITTAVSEDGAGMRGRLSVLTLFEIATGAQLATRFGLLAEYDNCLFIKGMKFATPDGIYSSGFVIVSRKHSIQADDVWKILFMKLIRLRYTNVYMYDVNGSTVDQKARLVYPGTFTLWDLVTLSTNILS